MIQLLLKNHRQSYDSTMLQNGLLILKLMSGLPKWILLLKILSLILTKIILH